MDAIVLQIYLEVCVIEMFDPYNQKGKKKRVPYQAACNFTVPALDASHGGAQMRFSIGPPTAISASTNCETLD